MTGALKFSRLSLSFTFLLHSNCMYYRCLWTVKSCMKISWKTTEEFEISLPKWMWAGHVCGFSRKVDRCWTTHYACGLWVVLRQTSFLHLLPFRFKFHFNIYVPQKDSSAMRKSFRFWFCIMLAGYSLFTVSCMLIHVGLIIGTLWKIYIFASKDFQNE